MSIIPVDFLANSLIVTGWHAATFPDERQLVVNLTLENTLTFAEILRLGPRIIPRAPSIKLVRPIARNAFNDGSFFAKINHHCTKLISHTLFAYLMDLAILLTGNRRILVKVTQKMHRAMGEIAYFNTHQWNFVVDNYKTIQAKLSPEESVTFQYDEHLIDWQAYFTSAHLGARRYLLKEDDSTLEAALKRQKRLIFIYGSLEVALYLALIAFIGLIGYYCLLKTILT